MFPDELSILYFWVIFVKKISNLWTGWGCPRLKNDNEKLCAMTQANMLVIN